MKKVLWLIMLSVTLYSSSADAQSMHFSQYYNAPLLLNPANTALLPEDDFQLGMNYRNQWSAVPVPYNTFSAFGHCKIGGNSNNENHNNWLGLGLAFFNDKAGDGNLSLTEVQGDIAYHLQLSSHTLLSAGLSGAIAQRSVNYDKLIFDSQWDGAAFNTNIGNNEKVGIIKTGYYTVGAGMNLSWFPNDNMYVKLGGSLENINKPVESFYKANNTIDYRPVGDLDMLFKTGSVLIINPSVYYTTQSGAAELVFGSLFRTVLNAKNQMPSQLILGIYTRMGDALIGVAGVQIGPVQFMANYDFTMSGLAPYNGSYGALEFSVLYSRPYHPDQGIKKMFSCPRFF